MLNLKHVSSQPVLIQFVVERFKFYALIRVTGLRNFIRQLTYDVAED